MHTETLNTFSFACLLWKTLFKSSTHFLIGFFMFLLLSYISSLHILDINPLCIVWFANVFSHSIGCLFILLVISFAVQEVFSLMLSHLFIFAFVACASVVKKSLPRPRWWSPSTIFSSRCFVVLGLKFNSFLVNILWMVRKRSNFSFICVYTVFPTPFIKETILFPLNFLGPCQILVDHLCMGLFLAFHMAPLVYMSVFMPVPYCFDY